MQSTTNPPKLRSEGVPSPKALLVIDLGNGEVKALIRPAESTKLSRVSFPSHVVNTDESHSGCLRVLEGKELNTYLIGEPAAAVPMSHTGRDEQGKVRNAKLLMLHAIRLAFGAQNHVHADVIFTSPSNKAYGAEIAAQLQGVHPVIIPADDDVIGSEAQSFTVTVYAAVPQLEGHYAFSQLKLKKEAWVIDCGNRTLICTKVAPNGRILKRQYFGGSGVRGMAERITQRESLAPYIKEHTPQRVIDFILGEDVPAQVAENIARDVQASAADALDFIGSDTAPRFLIGGGAWLPGLNELLSAKVTKDPQWINIKALAAIADQILRA